MSDSPFVETRHIALPNGSTLEMQMTQAYIDALRKHFELTSEQPLEDDHVRMYLYGAANTAISKAEQDVASRPTAAPQGVRRAPRRKKGARG